MKPEPGFDLFLTEEGMYVVWTHTCKETLGPHREGPVEVTTRLPLGSRGWELVSEEPLTIQPSILCHRCGTHGWIREGRWIGT